jgi:hypothetical protein
VSIRLSAILLCDSAVADSSGKLTLYGVFNNLQAPSFPTVHPQMTIYFSCFVDEPAKLSVALFAQSGDCVFRSDSFEVEAGANPSQAHGIYSLIGMKLNSPGAYKLSLMSGNSDEIGSTLLTVTQREGQK